ncbi:MAG: FHA domain-containing protein [Planctomycetes bacterium]|nr:FHA domain-containing protein [Planctomycetota bacterium]MCP4772302.1 FHA domain-containing protein [Planctomycetota bacterium]MCP4861598.1 FHA domain-containing protein [Planctomycetota bacterium]
MVQIEILSGPESGQIFDLGVGTHTLGRAASNSRVLGVESVSGRHLELTVSAAGEIRFRDLGSTNGTWSGGVQVAEGEWFPGSEIKLGKCVLRLVPEGGGASSSSSTASSEVEDDDSDIHRRAREAAMSSKRKGGPLQMALGVVLVLAAGGGAWWTFGRGGAAEEGNPGSGNTAAANGGVSSQALDAIDGLGDFQEPEAWSLSKGTTIEEGRLSAGSGRSTARLGRNFSMMDTALEISASVSGNQVFPQISWGKGEESSQPVGTWEGGDLAAGNVTLSLPADAEWFQIALRLEGQGSLSELSVETTSRAPQKVSSPIGTALHEGANLMMSNSSGALLTARGQNGTWSDETGGLLFTPNGEASVVFSASGDLLEAGAFLLLADGGPVGLAPGVIVESSPGILLGGGATRLLLTLDQASSIRFEDGGASLTTTEPFHLHWDLAEAMTQAARLSQAITRAEREGNDRQLLASAAELLRDLPLDELKVQEALLRSQEALERGRADLANLQIQASGAVFVGAGSLMSQLANDARDLASRYPGTVVEPQATALAADLEIGAEQAAQGSQEAASEYRERLQGALTTSYPVLAAWLKEVN